MIVTTGALKQSFARDCEYISISIYKNVIPIKEEGERRDRKPLQYRFKTPKEIKIMKKYEKILKRELQWQIN